MRVLLTAGGTEEPIDGVRRISNSSTGATGKMLAAYFHQRGADVLLLHAERVQTGELGCRKESFLSFADLEQALRRHLSASEWDAVVHLAAVADYSIDSIKVDGKFFPPGGPGKIGSGKEVILGLRPNPKLVDSLRPWSRTASIRVIAFKLTDDKDPEFRRRAVEELLNRAQPDLVVHNDLSEISHQRHEASIYDRHGLLRRTSTKEEMAGRLWEWIVGGIHAPETAGPSEFTALTRSLKNAY